MSGTVLGIGDGTTTGTPFTFPTGDLILGGPPVQTTTARDLQEAYAVLSPLEVLATQAEVDDVAAQLGNTVRFTFDVPMRQENASESNDALNPDNYSFFLSGITLPEPESVVSIAPNVVDVVLDGTLPGSTQITWLVANIETANFPAVATPLRFGSFTSLSAPELESAVAQPNLISVLVTFSEDVKQINPEDSDSALNPDNYTFAIAPPTIPAIASIATGPTNAQTVVTFVSPLPEDITTTLTVENVVSAPGAVPIVPSTVTFTTLTQPQLASAVPRTLNTVQVNFTEAVKQVDPENSDDARNPNNYTSSTGTVDSVAFTDPPVPQAVILVFASDLPEDQVVTLTAENIESTPNDVVIGTDAVQFTTLTQPDLVAALPQPSLDRLVVTFSEGVRQIDESEEDDALNPDNYVLANATVLPEVQSVIAGATNSEVTLVFDTELPQGEMVTLTARNIRSATSAVIVSSDPVQFTSFTRPQVLTATAQTAALVEIEYSEDVKQISAEDADDALNPDNYGTVFGSLVFPVDTVLPGLTGDVVTLSYPQPLPPDTNGFISVSAVVSEPNRVPIEPTFLPIATGDAPIVQSAVAVSPTNVVVTFSATVKQVDADEMDDALRPLNYNLSAEGSFPSNPDSVSPGAEQNAVNLTFSTPLPEFVEATLGVVNVISDPGNVVVDPSTVMFTTISVAPTAFVKPYDNAVDGVFSRPSNAWAEDPNSASVSILSYGANERRIFEISSENNIVMEGARRNLAFPNDPATASLGWLNCIPAPTVPGPTGTQSSRIEQGNVGSKVFAEGLAWQGIQSVYVLAGSASPDDVRLTMSQATPGTSDELPTTDTDFVRLSVFQDALNGPNEFGISLVDAEADQFISIPEIQVNEDASDPVRFASQPIITEATGPVTRARDSLSFIGDLNSAATALIRGIRVRLRPQYSSANIDTGQEYALCAIADPTTNETMFRIVIQRTSSDAVRVRALTSGAMIESPPVTFSPNDALSVLVQNSGALTLSGFDSGNGSFPGDSFVVPEGTLYYGSWPTDSFPGTQFNAFSTLAPLEFLGVQPSAALVAVQTATSAFVLFSPFVKRVDSNAPDDALNISNYTFSADAMLPAIESAEAVVLGIFPGVLINFEASLPRNETITLSVANIVSEAFPQVPVSDFMPEFVSFASALILEAVPLSRFAVRVVFSENVKQVDPGDADDALNPANYTLVAGFPIPEFLVTEGEDGASTVLNFVSALPGPELVELSVANIVSAVDGTVVSSDPVEFTTLSTLQATSILQLDLRSFRITFSVPVQLFNPQAPDDGLNPDNYPVSSFQATVPDPQAVIGSEDGLSVVVQMDQPLPAQAEIVVRPENIISAENETIVIGPTALRFVARGEGIVPVQQIEPLAGRFDLANPQTGRDAGNEPLGTFSITEIGDIRNDTGREYLRKRIYRRLSTTPGGFFHLPNYGLRPEDKELVTLTTLRRLQNNIEAQVLEEPDVLSVSATLARLAPGVIAVLLRVRDSLGPFEIEGEFSTRDEST